MKYSQPLNIDFDPITKLPPLKLSKLDTTHMWIVDENFSISKELENFLNDHNVLMGPSNLFYTAPNSTLYTHVDGEEYLSELCAINWVWGSPSHKMNWYTVKDEYIDTLPSYREDIEEFNGETYYFLNLEKMPKEHMNLEESLQLTCPTLVRTGVAHGVQNFSKLQGRFCFSISLLTKDKNFLKYSEALKLFQSYFKNSP